ncbi:MAG: Polyketide synthase PksL, partial [Verrucomicrobiota bacterium]
LIADIQKDHGKIDGIFHSAGIVRDRLIINKTEDEFRDVIAPKVSGAAHLDQTTRAMALDFFVLFSAGAGVLGNPGQADYATANAFMDEFARYRNTLVTAGERRGMTLSVDWPLWEAGGMTMDKSVILAMKEKLGMSPMATCDGTDALRRALASGKDQVLVVSRGLPRLPSRIARETVKKPSQSADGTLEEKTVEYFRELLSSTLRVPLHRIHPDGVMSDLGIDSVVVMSLTNRLEESFGSLSKTLFFEYQTVRALACYFIESHAEKLALLFQPEVKIANDAAKPLNGSQTHFPVLPSVPSLKKSVKEDPRSVSALDIAIIGVSGRYPKAKNIQEFWEVLREGRDCITEVPADRWDWRDYYSEDPSQTKGHSSKWGGFIEGVDLFDPQFFNISPRIAPYLDPQERLILEEAWKALEDAGYCREDLRKQVGEEAWSPVGVYIGAMYGEYQLLGAEASQAGQRLGFAGNLASIANRLSYVLNLHGPSMMVDTMCSSSLTCIHLACQDLAAGRTNYALAGGVNVTIHPNKYLMLSGGQFLSAAGRCESFGEGGAGYIPSEGVGVVVLKRLADAERDGDHIYGVIKSSAVNHGGRTHGYSVPNPKAQERVIAQALEEAGIDPRSVSYIEAHGTGTKLGDPIEIAGLARAFGRQSGDVRCWLGSAKSNIGHCESAAGIAGLTKVLLQMEHGQIAPSLHSQVLNPHIDFAPTPFVVNQTLREWEQPLIDGQRSPRIAGVSSFGAGGSNAHILVEEYQGKRDPVVPHDTRRPALIVLSAKSEERLIAVACALHDYLKQSRDFSPELLRNLAYTLQVGREAMEERLAFVATSLDELKAKLAHFMDDRRDLSGLLRGRIDDEQRIDPHERMDDDNDFNLLKRWVRGHEIDWLQLYGNVKPRRISLPTYPFVRKRYWVESVREIPAPELRVQTLVLKNEGISARPVSPLEKPSGVMLAPLSGVSTTLPMVELTTKLPAQPMSQAPEELRIHEREHKEATVTLALSPAAPKVLHDELRSSLAQVLFLEEHELGLDKSFLEMGLDSIIGVEWVNAINKKYKQTIPASQVYEHPSLRKFADFLHQQMQPSEVMLQAVNPPRLSDLVRLESEPSAAVLSSAPSEPAAHRVRETKATDIAIIGMSGQFPGGQTLDVFWQLLKSGKSAFTGHPQDRGWDLTG